MIDISVCSTKVNGRPKGRPSDFKKGKLEHPEKKRILHVIKDIHSVASSYFRKATTSRSPIGFKGD